MKKIFLTTLALLIAVHVNVQPAGSQTANNNIEQTYVTVYNNDLGVIRQLRSFDVPNGISDIFCTDVAALIDPTTVNIKLDGQVLEQNYRYDLVSLAKVLEKYIDKEINLDGEKFITGTLLSVDERDGKQGIVIRTKEGGLIMINDASKYRISVASLPEGLMTKPTLVWKVNSPKKGNQEVELSYHTAGMKWHAEYVAVLNEDDTKMNFSSWVSIDNQSGASYNDATLKLIAGKVNRVGRGALMKDFAMAERSLEVSSYSSIPAFEENPFFEYHSYNLQYPTTLANNEIKQVSLFKTDNIKVKKVYNYASSIWQNAEDQKVNVVIEFENKKGNNLGMPLPAGVVRISKMDGKTTEFVGEDRIEHTPKDEELKLKMGNAFDINIDDITVNNELISKKVTEITAKLTIKNHKDEKVVVSVEKTMEGSWEITKTSHDYVKKDAQNAKWEIPVKADGETELTFTVRMKN